MNKVAFCISMYNEQTTVQNNIDNIRDYYGDNATIIIVQSDSGKVVVGSDFFGVNSNLGNTLNKYKVPAHALTRNFSKAFSTLYGTTVDIDFIVGMTGDTLITDVSNFDRRYSEMLIGMKFIAISQAIGQNFHAADAHPPEKTGGRIQYPGIYDFMPQLFILAGRAACKNRIFSKITITNEFTSEQCLGDELQRNFNVPLKNIALFLSDSPYGYSDGIKYHVTA